jgi:hypothetical protein
MDATFFSSMLSETDYRIFGLTSSIISSGLGKYAAIGFSIYFTLELIKMMYMRQPMDVPNLLLALLIASALTVYSDVAKGFDMEMNDIYSSIKKTAGNVNVALAQGTYKGTSMEADVASELSSYTTDEDKMDVFDEFFTGNLSSVIYLIMSGIRKTMLLFMYAIGPVCMVFSMFPIFGIKVLKNWFFYLLNVHLWELGFIILQIIQSQIGFWRGVENNSTGVPEIFSGNGWAYACYNVTCFICFSMVPYLTGKLLIGLSQPSSFGTRAIGAAAMVSRSVGGAIRSRAGSGGGGGGAVNTVKNVMQNSAKAADGDGGGGSGGSTSMASKAGKMYGNVVKNFKSPPVS